MNAFIPEPMLLSNDAVNKVEHYLSYFEPIKPSPVISDRDIEYLYKSWEIINTPEFKEKMYVQFASNCYGMYNYGFYKSVSGKVYGLISYCGSMTNFFIPDEDWYMEKDMKFRNPIPE